MAIELPSLPYARDALVPYISKETIDYHYGKHHQAYITKLNQLIEGTELQNKSLEEIMLSGKSGAVFNNAGQAWNHAIYWKSMKKTDNNEDNDPQGELGEAIKTQFGSFSAFREAFITAAMGRFGSGWAWLAVDNKKNLKILTTANASNPKAEEGYTVLFGCDIWEHAYYIDTRNDRAKYLDNFFKVINWDYVSSNFC